jgi:two-component system, NarL family, invasion response regulator UvrY
MPANIKVLVADDHTLYRDALIKILSRSGFTIIATARNEAELMSFIHPLHLPDIAIISYKTTRPATLASARWVKQHYPQVKVLVMTLFNYLVPIDTFMQSGIEGLVIKARADPRQIVNALKQIHKGEVFYAG